MEIVAVRESDDDGLAYLVQDKDQGYIVEGGEAVRVNVERALSYDSWPEEVPFDLGLMADLARAIDRLKSDEFVRESGLFQRNR